jgi:hypothetical protein
MEYYYAFKKGLKLIFRNFVSFVKKLFVVAFLYGLPMIIPLSVAVLMRWGLSSIPGIDPYVASLICKIIATAGQIIPLSIYLYVAENELIITNEDAPELCFAFCAAVITLIWTCL